MDLIDFLLSIRDDVKFFLEHKDDKDNLDVLDKIIGDIDFVVKQYEGE